MLISVISAGITYSSFSGWLFLKLILSIKEKTFHSNNKKRRKNNERERSRNREQKIAFCRPHSLRRDLHLVLPLNERLLHRYALALSDWSGINYSGCTFTAAFTFFHFKLYFCSGSLSLFSPTTGGETELWPVQNKNLLWENKQRARAGRVGHCDTVFTHPRSTFKKQPSQQA